MFDAIFVWFSVVQQKSEPGMQVLLNEFMKFIKYIKIILN